MTRGFEELREFRISHYVFLVLVNDNNLAV